MAVRLRCAFAAAVATAAAAAPPPLPASLASSLDIGDGLTVSGISSGADFAVQFHVAFSALVRGAGIFAGKPYHCSVTRFANDATIPCSKLSFDNLSAGCAGFPLPGVNTAHRRFDPEQAPCDPPCPE
eukprot:COSAG05_NODE_13486_length_428_cov_0.808511_1_plen_127_part_10